MQAEARRLILLANAESATFRRLVARLEASDVIIFVGVSRDLPSALAGSTTFTGRAGSSRFLTVRLNRSCGTTTLLGVLGHELQHVVEVADAADVSSSEDLRALYRRIGVRTGPNQYDSLAARQAGAAVRAEVGHGRRAPRVARGGRNAAVPGIAE
jgi:hypothetical protein